MEKEKKEEKDFGFIKCLSLRSFHEGKDEEGEENSCQKCPMNFCWARQFQRKEA